MFGAVGPGGLVSNGGNPSDPGGSLTSYINATYEGLVWTIWSSVDVEGRLFLDNGSTSSELCSNAIVPKRVFESVAPTFRCRPIGRLALLVGELGHVSAHRSPIEGTTAPSRVGSGLRHTH
jgi:hypothetical protein